jgi:methanol--5-hydroxybenzimidazolylcobamide Co-methyltransferase
MRLSKYEKDVLMKIIVDLKSLPDDQEKFKDWALKTYKNIPMFNPKNYGL